MAMIAVIKDANNSIEKRNLFEHLGQNFVQDPYKKISNTFNRWEELGLFFESADKISIKENYLEKLSKRPRPGESKLQLVLLEVLMAEANNVNFWQKEKSKNSDFSRCCCYILGLDIFFLSSKTTPEIIKISGEQAPNIDPELLLQNETRITGIKHWMTSLGFLTGNTKPTIDPTIMVRSVISDNLTKGEEIVFDKFLKKLNTKFPILDGGKLRVEVEKKLQSKTTNLYKSATISISLSFALRRLRSEGIIEFIKKSDAKKFNLLGRDCEPFQELSHLKYTGR